MSETAAVRETEGISLPPAGTWGFDKAHTTVGFVARHMLTKVRGRFDAFDGAVVIAERPEDSHVEVEIDVASIGTQADMRDNHLRSSDFFDAETYPKMTFRSREVRPTGGATFQLVGDLTIKEITNEVVLDAEFVGWGPGPSAESPTVASFSAWAEINREDWEMTWNVAVETGSFLVGKRVKIEIEAELQLKP